jgi:PII-like signaling protein
VVEGNYLLVRIFMREDDELDGERLYSKLLKLLKSKGVGGATVLKAIMSYGTTSEYHYEGIEVLSYNLPVVVEFVEKEEKVNSLLEELTKYVKKGLISIERAQVWVSS